MCIEKTMKGAAGAQATGDGFSKLDLEKALREALEEGVKFACEQASKVCVVTNRAYTNHAYNIRVLSPSQDVMWCPGWYLKA